MCVCVLDVLFLARLQTSVLHGVRDETVRVRAEVLKESEAAKKKKKEVQLVLKSSQAPDWKRWNLETFVSQWNQII